MPLNPVPTAADLSTFSHGEMDVFTVQQRMQAIDQAVALFWIATRLDEYPSDETLVKIIDWGLLDMAWSLLIKTENKTETSSGFASERIGSYSYSKAMSQAQSGSATGVEWFDAAVSLILGDAGEGAVWSTTEQVFTTPYDPSEPSLYGSVWY